MPYIMRLAIAGDNGLLLSLGSEKFFFTDGRYELEAKEKILMLILSLQIISMER